MSNESVSIQDAVISARRASATLTRSSIPARSPASASIRSEEARTLEATAGTWRRLSAIILARDPLCKIAKLCVVPGVGLPAPSQCADHVIPKSRGGKDELSNLQGACFRCHDWKTAVEDSKFVKRAGASGG